MIEESPHIIGDSTCDEQTRVSKRTARRNKSLTDEELNLSSAMSQDQRQERKRKIQNTRDELNPYVKLKKLGPKQMTNLLAYDTDEDTDQRDETYHDTSEKESTTKKLTRAKYPVSINSASEISRCKSDSKTLNIPNKGVREPATHDKSSSCNRKSKLVVKVAPLQVKNEIPVSKNSVKKLALYWEDFSVKARAKNTEEQARSQNTEKQTVSQAKSAPVRSHDIVSQTRGESASPCTRKTDENTQKEGPEVPVNSQDLSVAQPDDKSNQPCKTPDKTRSNQKINPGTPKSPKEVIHDYTRTVQISRSKSAVSCKSSKLDKLADKIEKESPGKWGKKSFRRLFPDHPTVTVSPPEVVSSPEVLESQTPKKKCPIKKRSLMSLNPAVYSQFFSPPPNENDLNLATTWNANNSVEAARKAPEDSFVVSELSSQNAVASPEVPSYNESLTTGMPTIEISRVSNSSEMEMSLLNSSAVNRAISETVTRVLGNNRSNSFSEPKECELEKLVATGTTETSTEEMSYSDGKGEEITAESPRSKGLSSNGNIRGMLSEEKGQDSFFSPSVETPNLSASKDHEGVQPDKTSPQKEIPTSAAHDEPPPLLSANNYGDLQPPALSPYPSVLEKLNTPHTKKSSSVAAVDEDMPDLLSPRNSLKPPVLSPHPPCLEMLRRTGYNYSTAQTSYSNTQVTPALQQFPGVGAKRTKMTTKETSVLSSIPSYDTISNTDQESEDCAMDLTCFEEHEKENIPDARQGEESTVTVDQTYSSDATSQSIKPVSADNILLSEGSEAESCFSPSYLGSSQLMWSPTPVPEESPQPQVLTNRKSVKRPRKLQFDQEVCQPNPKILKLTEKANTNQQGRKSVMTAVTTTSSIRQLSQILSSSEAAATRQPAPTLTNRSVCASKASTSCSSASYLTPASAVSATSTSAIQTFQRRIYEPISARLAPPRSTDSSVGGIQQKQQVFFGPDFTPTYTLKRDSSVSWKQYAMGSVTYTKNLNPQDTSQIIKTPEMPDNRITPEGAEKVRNHVFNAYTIHSKKSTQIDQPFQTSTPVYTESSSTNIGSVQENRPFPVASAVRVNAPVSTFEHNNQLQQRNQGMSQEKPFTAYRLNQLPEHQSEQTKTSSLFDHITANVQERLTQQLIHRRQFMYNDVVRTEMNNHSNEIGRSQDGNSTDAASTHSRASNIDYPTAQTDSPYMHQHTFPDTPVEYSSDIQNNDHAAAGTSTGNMNFNAYLWQNQLHGAHQAPPAFYVSSLCTRLQNLKPYTISGWISSTYLQALMQKTDLLNDMFSNALDKKGDIKDWVVENCRKSTPAVLARDLVFRIITLGKLERSIIIYNNLNCLPRTKMAAIRRCLQKQFPKEFDERVWRKKCLPYIKASVKVLFEHRVPQVQNFWLMHDLGSM